MCYILRIERYEHAVDFAEKLDLFKDKNKNESIVGIDFSRGGFTMNGKNSKNCKIK